MKKCDNCNVSVEGSHDFCPLCFKKLEYNKSIIYGQYPSYESLYSSIKIFTLKKIFLFSAIVCIIVSVTVNILTYKNTAWSLWSILVSISIIYVYINLVCLIFSDLYISKRILIEFIISSILVFIADIYFGFNGWSINFIIPFFSIASIASITMISAFRIKYFYEYAQYILISSFFGLCIIILPIFRLVTIVWPSIAAFIYSLCTILAMFIFFNNIFRTTLKKMFHF